MLTLSDLSLPSNERTNLRNKWIKFRTNKIETIWVILVVGHNLIWSVSFKRLCWQDRRCCILKYKNRNSLLRTYHLMCVCADIMWKFVQSPLCNSKANCFRNISGIKGLFPTQQIFSSNCCIWYMCHIKYFWTEESWICCSVSSYDMNTFHSFFGVSQKYDKIMNSCKEVLSQC